MLSESPVTPQEGNEFGNDRTLWWAGVKFAGPSRMNQFRKGSSRSRSAQGKPSLTNPRDTVRSVLRGSCPQERLQPRFYLSNLFRDIVVAGFKRQKQFLLARNYVVSRIHRGRRAGLIVEAASHILGRMSRLVPEDWQKIYAHPTGWLGGYLDFGDQSPEAS